MASAAAELFVKVSADIKGLTSGFKAVENAVDDMGQAAQQAAKPMSSLGDIIKGTAAGDLLADGIRSAADAMVNLGVRSLQLAGELEQNKVAFTTMLKSGEAADKMLRDLATFAASTPFELRGLTDSAKKLIAFGFSSQSIIPIMTSLGDAIGGIGGGQEAIGQVTMALGQMAAKGKVSAEEMNQFAEKGINTWKYVAQAIGKSVPEAMKLAEKGAIDAATAIPAILQGMSKEFGGMMEKQSKTWNGALSNFQDATDQAMTKIGDAIIRMGLGELIQKMTAGVNNLAAAFDSGRIIPAIQLTEAAVIGLAVAMASRLLPAAVASGAAMVASFVAASAAAAPFIALAAAVAFAAYPIIKNWQEIKWGLQDVFDAGMKYMAAFYNFGAGVVRDFANNWLIGMNYIAGIIRSVLGDTIADKLIGGVRSAGAAFSGFAAKAVPVLKYVGNAVRENVSGDLQWFAGNFKETWGDAMASAKLVTVDLFKTTAAGKVDVAKITAELLGLKKGQMAASDAAKKHHETAEQAAKRHARELKALEAQYQRNLRTYIAQEDVTYKLRDALKVVADDQERLGLAFDVAGAQAKVYQDILGQLETAYGKTSQQVMIAKQRIAEYEAASKNGGAALAKAYEIIGKAGAGLDLAQRQAEALGQAFDRNAEGVKIYEQAIKDLVEMGLKPGNEAYDKAIKSLDAYRAAQIKAPASLKDMAEAQRDVIGGLKDLVTGAFDVADMLGLQVPSAVKVGAVALFTGAATVGGMIMAVNSLTAAWATFTAAFATNPIGAALIVAGAAVVGIVAAVQAVRSEQQKAADEAAKAAEAVAAKAEEVKAKLVGSIESGLRSSAQAFMAGADSYQDKMRESFREGIINGVLDAMMQKAMLDGLGQLMKNVVNAAVSPMQAGLAEAMKAFADGAAGALAKLEPVLSGLRTQLEVYVPLAVKEADESAKRISRAASGGGMGGSASDMDRRNLEALESYRNNLLKTVERLVNAGAQNPASRLYNDYIQALDAANKATQDIGRMLNPNVEKPKLESNIIGLLAQDTFPNTTFIQPHDQYRGIAPATERAIPQVNNTVNVNYTGNGKWTREDAQGLGRMMVSELRAMGVR